jgi:hypothetical protein
MPTIDQLRAQSVQLLQRLVAHPDFDLIIVGALLTAVVLLSLVTIWRGRTRSIAPASASSKRATGFRRWLTPNGIASIPAAQVEATRARRRTGSQKTIRVITPVSKVPARALKARDADALAIARRSGLARDAVSMMLANADPKRATRTTSPERASAPQPASRGGAAERALTAPGAGNTAPRTAPAANSRTLGTQFNARLS